MHSQLATIGLSKSERTAYDALLSRGTLTPPELAKISGLTRVNSYAALNGLVQKGLVQRREVQNKLAYFLLPPTKLRELARRRRNEIQTNTESLEGIIPTLMNQYALVSGQPGISHYEGIEGIKKVYEATLRPPYPEEVLVLRSVYDSTIENKEVLDYLFKYVERRAKLGMKNRTISPQGIGHPSLDEEELLRSLRFLPRENFSIPAEISIFGDKVALISMRKDLIATVIQSEDVVQTLRILFELIWQSAQTNPPTINPPPAERNS